MPTIIPLISASNSVPPSTVPLPPIAPPLPSVVPSVFTPPSTVNESQTTTNNEVNTENNNDDDDDGGNPLLAQIRNFAKTNKLKSASKTNPVDEAPLPSSHEQESIMDSLKKRLMQRRGFITGETSSSTSANLAEKPVAPSPVPPPASTGGAFTDAIAAKAKEIANQQQIQKDDSDNDDDEENWE
ncbi:unnamed protein product [Rotaria sp. Silwood1]|nr:unnamed protein product [Rotaria sp. Silwood1]